MKMVRSASSAQFLDDKMEGNSKGWFLSGQQQFDYNFQKQPRTWRMHRMGRERKKNIGNSVNNGVPAQDLLTGQRIATPYFPSYC